MAQIDYELKEIMKRELGKTDRMLGFCPAHTEVISGPMRFIIPLAIPGFAILGMATRIPIFTALSILILIFTFVIFPLKYKNYLVIATETQLVLLQVSNSLLKYIGTQRFPYQNLLSVSESGSGSNLSIAITPKESSPLKLVFHSKLRKITDNEGKMFRLLEILRTSVPGYVRA